jgi:RHS repeat-associated protein
MRKIQPKFFHVLSFLLLIYCLPSFAQVGTGTPPFGSFGGGPDVINLGNLNAHITVPVLNKAGRGIPFTYNLTYDSSVWYPVGSSGSQPWTPVYNWGWSGQTQANTGYLNASTSTVVCSYIREGTLEIPNGWKFTEYGFVYYDPWGVPHPFTGTAIEYSSTCSGTNSGVNSLAADGSGYTLSGAFGTLVLTAKSGKVIKAPFQTGTGVASFTDRNGNEISVNSSGVFTDTLGTTALTVAGVAPSNTTFTYTAPSGANASYTMKYTSYNVLTNFGCSGIAEYSATGVSLVSEIDLPDQGVNANDKYTFTYEATPSHSGYVTGRLASVTLPTGGTISYTYTGSNNGIECSDGSAAGLNRMTPDGESQYTRSGSGTAWTTTVTDPASNQTQINFQSVTPAAGPPIAFYETERQIYQGSTSGTLLKTVFTCYNATTSSCNSTAIVQPIDQRAVYVLWPGTGGLESLTNTFYNTYGSSTETDEYAYGVGAPGSIVRKTLTTYASLGNGIVAMPATVTIEDGSSNVHSQTTYSYDQTGVTATSGTPQQAAVSGSRGNATTISYYTGSSSLNKTYTYYDTGNVNAATDVNSAVTTYSYGSGTSCGNSFATSVSEPLSLSRSLVWNCTGGVQTSATDENGKVTANTYSDPYFWHPQSVTDAASNVAIFTYDAAFSVGGFLNFNGTTSTTNGLTTLDGLGRIHVSQRKESQSSSTYDSVETDYDDLGRPSRTTVPYAATAGSTNSSAPGTNTTYDALNRKLQVTDNDGGSVTLTYTQNDTYRTLGPAPAGENTKRKQTEYDALGRLTSVCEITNATGSGSCAQTSPVAGYWTKYTYDVLNNLTGVTQNAQSSGNKQNRTYVYDDLSRLTSETNPESGTTSYTYDTDSTCGASKGDLVKKVDAVGNTTCYAYDVRHRLTSTTYSGPYALNTPNRYFVYDAATVNSVTMANANTHMAEAYTCVSPCSTKITDLGFSYTVLGQLTDVYESTPHSSGYYHVTSTYYPNGALNQLGNLVGLPTITYGVDGEGRVYSASAASGQNPLTSISYNTASLPTQVSLGSSDSDSYTFDPSSNRVTQYKFSVNGQSVIGAVTWNPIGTLESLGVTDPFYSGGNQTCSYTHDDMSRIAGANCGSSWTQTFSSDAFGNITKSGTISFQPTYSYLTNRMTQIGSSNPSYDANGNVTNDTAHTYSWDANGMPWTVDSVGLTYDALGRMVEQNRSGVYTEIVYSPVGSKLALMNGTTLHLAFVPLAGGSVAVYNSSGLAYYRHSDWLGSSRFASTPARAMYFDGAYAPFGENYAQTGTTDLSFTGMNQDTVTNLFDFPAREYNAIHGRWPSPDPSGLASAQLSNPQTLNRYAYVMGNPLSFTDPSGLHVSDCWWTGTCNSGNPAGAGAGGGGYGGGVGPLGCTLDGADVGCAGLGGNGMMACPNNNCGYFNYNYGEWVYFAASTNGNGAYFPVEGPGWVFGSDIEALAAGAIWAAAETADDGVENCGMTYSDGDGNYSFTGSSAGTVGSCQPTDSMSLIPSNDTGEGGYHSQVDAPGYLPERFSGQPGDNQTNNDVGWADQYGGPLSLGTPGGIVTIYYPDSNCQIFWIGSPAGTGTTIPTCQ